MKITKLETNEEYVAYHQAMAYMYANNISIVNIYDKGVKLGGLTIAFGNVFPDSKMVEVAVSYCDVQDEYVPEVGNMLAIAKFEECETIQIPIGKASPEQQAKILAAMFTEMYNQQ